MRITSNRGDVAPQKISHRKKLGLRQYTVAFDVREVAGEGPRYAWAEAEFAPGVPQYGDMVSAFIRGRYSEDAMQALINNHLLGDGDECHEAEWDEMQRWRAESKRLAKEVLEEIAGAYV